MLLCVVGMLACGSDSRASSGADAGGANMGGSGAGSGAGAGGDRTAGGSSGSAFNRCPDAEPETGSACGQLRGTCEYAGRECDCPAELSTWVCWDPAQCPTQQPAEQASCDTIGMGCSFGARSSCDCTAAGWDCGGQVCPQDKPTVGETCERAPGECSYEGLTCDCSGNTTWACWDPADCPTTPPASGASCANDGMRCAYGGGRCECDLSDGWSCDRRVDRDTDAGVDDSDAGL